MAERTVEKKLPLRSLALERGFRATPENHYPDNIPPCSYLIEILKEMIYWIRFENAIQERTFNKAFHIANRRIDHLDEMGLQESAIRQFSYRDYYTALHHIVASRQNRNRHSAITANPTVGVSSLDRTSFDMVQPATSKSKSSPGESITDMPVLTIPQETLTPLGRITLDDVKGQPNAVNEARRLVVSINRPELYTRRGISPPRGILLTGPPGTGKTMLAKGIAVEANADLVVVSIGTIGSPFVNESALQISQAFDDAEKRAKSGRPVILLFDEIDALVPKRAVALGDSGEDNKVTSIILQRMDGYSTSAGVTVLGTTNRADVLDPAILRPGRFDKKIKMDLPNERGRGEILQAYYQNAQRRAHPNFRNTLFDDKVNLLELAGYTDGCSGAELASIINRCLELKLDKEIGGEGWQPVTQYNLLLMTRTIQEERTAVSDH